ncbi:PREDICTED: uncharacterized protein LOC104598916 [Nelumbo nucifera]|uniref:Uncharacterized protein LOC104598916 n=1 Tax=Nelumbo nucifera TaxID=4432 RepID=A0A1U8ABN7_NELNU|nr:PREDICTED: uncharacterized protein LOC104598916 [Nelumbo nucifera]
MDSRGTRGGHLFQGMKRRKQVANRARAEPPLGAEPEMVPLMQEPAGAPYAETTHTGAPAYSESAHTRAGPSGSEAPGDFRSMLSPVHALQWSKEAMFPEEVAAWTELPLHQVACRAVTHAMVVNSSIHALANQVERCSRQARAAEEAARTTEEAARAAEAAARLAQSRQARSQRDAEAMGVVVKHMAELKLVLEH